MTYLMWLLVAVMAALVAAIVVSIYRTNRQLEAFQWEEPMPWETEHSDYQEPRVTRVRSTFIKED
jgi:hypothetical protein